MFDITTAAPVTIDGFQSTYVGTDAGGQQATGGLVLDTQSGNQLTFEDNVVPGSQFNNALIFDDSASSSTITNNLFTGTTQYHDNGTGIIGAWGGPSQQADVTITGNTFTGLTEVPSSPGSPNGTPVLNINDDGGTISGNTFSDLHEYGILLADKLANLNITGNTFTGIFNDTPASSSNRGSAIRLFTADDSLDLAGPVNVDLNTFTDMYHAVDVANDGYAADLSSGNLTVHRNAFTGPFTGSGTGVGSTNSTAINLASGTIGTLNATCNWWGGVPTANQYSGSVTVSPYLLSASPLATATCGVSSNTSLITSAPTVQIGLGKNVKFTVTTAGHPVPTLSVVGLPGRDDVHPGIEVPGGYGQVRRTPVGRGRYLHLRHPRQQRGRARQRAAVHRLRAGCELAGQCVLLQERVALAVVHRHHDGCRGRRGHADLHPRVPPGGTGVPRQRQRHGHHHRQAGRHGPDHDRQRDGQGRCRHGDAATEHRHHQLSRRPPRADAHTPRFSGGCVAPRASGSGW